MPSIFKVVVDDPEHQRIVGEGGDALRGLCQKEATEFSQWLSDNEPNFSSGLANWEKHILSVYLYKKIRGVDEQQTPTEDPMLEEGKDVSP